MSSNEHRAAAVQLYGRLSKFAQEPAFKTQYLDLCQTVIGIIIIIDNKYPFLIEIYILKMSHIFKPYLVLESDENRILAVPSCKI